MACVGRKDAKKYQYSRAATSFAFVMHVKAGYRLTPDSMRWQKRCQGTGAGALMKSNATSEILAGRMKGLSSPIRKKAGAQSREQPCMISAAIGMRRINGRTEV